MKIIEILQKEGIGGAVAGLAKGADEFIKGASGGKTDIGGTVRKYAGPTIKGAKGTRSVGRELEPEKRFDNLMANMYGAELTPDMKAKWKAAIQSKDPAKIKAANNDYEKGLSPTALGNDGKLKPANKQAIADMAGLDVDRL